MYLSTLDFIVIAAYFVGMFLVGLVSSRWQDSQEEYFLAGRRTSSLLAGISVVATLFSTVSFLALPGEMIRYGAGYFSGLLAFVFIIPVVNRVIIPALMRLPVISVYDYLERRFGPSARTLGATIFVVTRLIWIALILYTASRAVAPMTGWSLPPLVCVMGIVTISYATMGGLLAVLWTDFAQFVILFAGAVLVPGYVAWHTFSTPLQWWDVFSQANRVTVPVFSFDPAERITIVGIMLVTFVANVCTHGSDQVAAQRYMSTPSLATARRSFWIFSLANVALLSMLMVCGLALFYFSFHTSELPLGQFQSEIAKNADNVLPEFLARQLPPGVSGFLLAALLSAAMSSLSSGINSISAVTVTDLLPAKWVDDADHGLTTSRWLGVLSGAFAIAGAICVDWLMSRMNWNLIDLMERLNQLFTAPLGAMFLAGICFNHVGLSAVLIGFVAGLTSSILISFSEWLFAYPISFMWIMPGSFFVSILVTYLAGFLFQPPSAQALAAFKEK